MKNVLQKETKLAMNIIPGGGDTMGTDTGGTGGGGTGQTGDGGK